MKPYQEYIFMSEPSFVAHGKQFYPDAVLVGTYRLAPYVNTKKVNIETYCSDNDLQVKTLKSAAIIKHIENNSCEVMLTDIDSVFEVKAHFEPEITEE